jgi:hypothetical protein
MLPQASNVALLDLAATYKSRGETLLFKVEPFLMKRFKWALSRIKPRHVTTADA